MSSVNQFMQRLFAALWQPFDGLSPWVSIWVFSLVMGVVALIAVKYLSNQTRIVELKDKYKAHVLAIKLFRDDLGVVLKSLGRTLWSIFLYMGHNMRPMVLLMIPMMLIFAQMQMRLAYDPLEVGDRVYVHVAVAKDVDLTEPNAVLETVEVRELGGEEVVEDAIEFFGTVTPVVLEHQVVFPIVVKKEGAFDLVFRAGDEEVTKSLHVGPQEGLPMLSPMRSNGFLDQVLYPTEPSFGADSAFEQIRLSTQHPYAIKPLMAFGMNLSWGMELGMGIWFILISIGAAFALKGVFGVEI